MMPQGYLHTMSHCFFMLIMLTSDCLANLKAAVHSLKRTLLTLGWAIDKDKVQGPGLSVEFLGIIWSVKTRTMTVS